ncbi:MAG: hypothetical protein ACSLEW_12575, partial [Nocardioides sp.]
MILGDSQGHLWQLVRQCSIGGAVTCDEAAQCGAEVPPRWMYDILRDGQMIGTTCLTDDEADELGVLTPGAIQRAFKAMTWPPADLNIQPPDGQTLVNLETIFYTTNVEPTVQTVTLLGTPVRIQATPIGYLWHHGDGTSSHTTDPGQPYPRPTVTHIYARTAAGLDVRVDVTYRGRFRLPGQPWQPIPDTLTVNGTPELLTVRQAQPHLTNTN